MANDPGTASARPGDTELAVDQNDLLTENLWASLSAVLTTDGDHAIPDQALRGLARGLVGAGGDACKEIETLAQQGAPHMQTQRPQCTQCSRDLPTNSASGFTCSICARLLSHGEQGRREVDFISDINACVRQTLKADAVNRFLQSNVRVGLKGGDLMRHNEQTLFDAWRMRTGKDTRGGSTPEALSCRSAGYGGFR